MCKITLDTWEVDQEFCSNTDVFVTVNDENVGADNFHWRTTFAVEKLEIYPDDEKLVTGIYRVAYMTQSDDPEICLFLSLSAPEAAIDLTRLD